MKVVEYSNPLLRSEALAADAASPVGRVVAYWVMVASVMVGIVLRFLQLGSASLWFDEGYTAWAVSHPVGEVIRIIKADTAPPLYYILLRGWTSLFGFSEAAMRSMSAVMASVALLYFVAIARRMLNAPWVIAIAVVLFSFSFMQIGYAHEARFYAMMSMLEAIDLYLVLLLCERFSMLRLTGLCLAWIASLYTMNMMVVYVGCLGIAWLVLPGKRAFRQRIGDLMIASIISALAFAPWVPTLLEQSRRLAGGFWPGRPDGVDLARTISFMAGVDDQGLPTIQWHWRDLLQVNFPMVNALLLGLALLACVSVARLRKVLAMFIAGVLPILIIFLYSRVRVSIFMERAFLASGIAIQLLIVFAIESVRSKAARALSLLGVVAFLYMEFRSIPGHRLGEHAESWRDASAFAQQSSAKHRLIVCVSSDGEPLYRYYSCERDYGPRLDVTSVPRSFFALNPPQTMQRVKSDRDLDLLRAMLANGNYDEVVLMASHTWWGDHDQRTLGYLEQELPLIEDRQFTGIKVFRFGAAESAAQTAANPIVALP